MEIHLPKRHLNPIKGPPILRMFYGWQNGRRSCIARFGTGTVCNQEYETVSPIGIELEQDTGGQVHLKHFSCKKKGEVLGFINGEQNVDLFRLSGIDDKADLSKHQGKCSRCNRYVKRAKMTKDGFLYRHSNKKKCAGDVHVLSPFMDKESKNYIGIWTPVGEGRGYQ